MPVTSQDWFYDVGNVFSSEQSYNNSKKPVVIKKKKRPLKPVPKTNKKVTQTNKIPPTKAGVFRLF